MNPLRSSSDIGPQVVVMPPPTVQSPFPPTADALKAYNMPMNNAHAQPVPPKSRRMRPTKSVTARYVILFCWCFIWFFFWFRNLCAIEWCKVNKGTADDFNKYWNGLPKEEKEVSKISFSTTCFHTEQLFRFMRLNQRNVQRRKTLLPDPRNHFLYWNLALGCTATE